MANPRVQWCTQDAFEVSYNGHIGVSHVLADINSATLDDPLARHDTIDQAIVGGIYVNNTIIAAGHVDSSGNLMDGFGARVRKAPLPQLGTYLIRLYPRQWNGKYDTLQDAEFSITLEDNDTTGMASFVNPRVGMPPGIIGDTLTLKPGSPGEPFGTCAVASVTHMSMFKEPNCFLIHIRKGSLAGCGYESHPFYFKVVAKPR